MNEPPFLAQRLRTIASHPDRHVVRSIMHAFVRADPSERNLLALELIRRGTALHLVVSREAELDANVRTALRDPGLDLGHALSTVISTDNPRPAVRLIRDRDQALEARLLEPLIHHLRQTPHDELSDEIADTLLAMATADGSHDPLGLRGRRRSLGALVGAATVGDGSTVRAELLLAGLLLAERDEPRLNDWINQLDDAARLSLRRIVGQVCSPFVTRHLVRWLGRAPIQSQVARRWHEAASAGTGMLADLLEESHLLRTPSRRRALRHAHRPVRCLPDPLAALALPHHTQSCLPDLLGAVGLTHRTRVERLGGCAALTAPLARLRGLLALRSLDRVEAAAAAVAFLRDPEPQLAGTAVEVLHAWPAAVSEPELLRSMVNDAPQELAGRAALTLAGRDPEAFLELAPRLEPAALACAAWRLHATHGTLFVALLSSTVAEGPLPRRRAALHALRRLGLEREAVSAIAIAARDPDPVLASSAAAALGAAAPETAAHALTQLVTHADARVRANAIESLARLPVDTTVVAEQAASDHAPRPRANAIVSLLHCNRAQGIDRLRDMLEDNRSAHRLSGLWAVQRHVITELAPRVRQIEREDEDARLVRRATATLVRLARAPRRHVTVKEIAA